MDAVCSLCQDFQDETNFYTRCGHHFHKTCLETNFSNTSELFCPLCTTQISLSQPEEYLEALKADPSLCFNDKSHMKMALELLGSGDLSYEKDETLKDILEVAESFGLKIK